MATHRRRSIERTEAKPAKPTRSAEQLYSEAHALLLRAVDAGLFDEARQALANLEALHAMGVRPRKEH